jgi:hypothetical protein
MRAVGVVELVIVVGGQTCSYITVVVFPVYLLFISYFYSLFLISHVVYLFLLLVSRYQPFLPYKCSYLKLANTCKDMGIAMSCQDSHRMWQHIELAFCIDPSCPLCPRKKKCCCPKAPGNILRKYPIANLDVHCLVGDLPALLSSMSSRGSIQKAKFTLSNKSRTPVLGALMAGSILNPTSFNSLRHLTIDSSHLTIVGLPGRAVILRAMGHHLDTLVLVGRSVSGIFVAIREHCPMLRDLRVDHVESESYFAQYSNPSLKILTLKRVGFMPSCLKKVCPNVERLSLTFTCHHSADAYNNFFASLPASVIALDIEMPGSLADSIIRAVGSHMPQIQEIRLRGAFDSGRIHCENMSSFLMSCPGLWKFEAGGSLSAFILTLDPCAVNSLSVGKKLTHITLRYEDRVAENFPSLLAQPNALTNITLWEQKKHLSEQTSWGEMSARMERVHDNYPNVSITLEDRS